MAKFIKKTGGSLYRKEKGKWKRYDKGGTIEVKEGELKSFRDSLERVGPPDKPVDKDDSPRKGLKLIHKGSGKYDVVNEESDKKINTKPLTKEEANELVAGSQDMER